MVSAFVALGAEESVSAGRGRGVHRRGGKTQS